MRNLFELSASGIGRKGIVYCTFLLLFFFSCTTLHAQSKSPLDTRISFKVDNATLADCIRKIREVTNIPFSFKPADLEGHRRITLDVANEMVRKILEKMLAGGKLQFIEGTGSNRGVLLIEKPTKTSSVKGDRWMELSGKVTDANGAGLSNVSVILPESHGVSTNAKGEFTVSASEHSIIRFSYLGMKSAEYLVKSDDYIKIVLDTLPVMMEEFIATGYQNIDKRMLTGAVTVLKPENFLTPGAASIDQMLQGKVPGMMTTFNSGSPSATPKIRIRGTSTIIGNASPLWVVDGIIREDPVNLNPLEVNAALKAAQDANFSIIGNAISGVNPYDIESLTFLSDATATSIYGVRAANGVIVVKTKSGKPGPPAISYNVSTGFTGKPSYARMNLMNSKERVEASKEFYRNGIYYLSTPMAVSYEGLYAKLLNREITQDEFSAQVSQLEEVNTDWLGLLSRNAFNHTHSLSVSGGNASATYYASLSYSKRNGTFKGDDLENYTADMRLTSKLTSRLGLSFILSGGKRTANSFYQVNPMDYALLTSRAIPSDIFYDAKISTADRGGDLMGNRIINYNIFNELENTGNTNTGSDINLNLTLTYDIRKGLSFQSQIGLGKNSQSAFSFATDHSYYIAVLRGYNFGEFLPGSEMVKKSKFPYGGLGNSMSAEGSTLNLRNTLNYSLPLFRHRDLLTVMAAQEIRSFDSKQTTSSQPGYYPDRGNSFYSAFYSAGGGAIATAPKNTIVLNNELNNTMSWIGSMSYRLMKNYSFYSSIRSDGSNRFGQYSNQRFLPNWSVGVNWDIAGENWLNKSAWIDRLSLRASYGSQGNVVSVVGPNLIASYPNQPADPLSSEFILDLKSLPYPDLRWEKTKSMNIGLDFSLFSGRLAARANIYIKHTKDLLLQRDIPVEYGIPTMYMNYGKMTNIGTDFAVDIVPVRSKAFEWTQTFIWGQNKNSIRTAQALNTYNSYLNGSAVVEGVPYSTFYSYKFKSLDPSIGIPLYDFSEGSAKFDAKNPSTFLVNSGRLEPTIEFSSNTYLRYKSFTLGAMMVVKYGNHRRLNPLYPEGVSQAPPAEMNLSAELAKRWRKPGDEAITNIPSFSNWSVSPGRTKIPGSNLLYSPYHMYDQSDLQVVNGSFLRITNLNMLYTVPSSFLLPSKVKTMTVGLVVNNPFVFANKRFNGQDPEVSNVGGTSLPITPSYMLTISLNL